MGPKLQLWKRKVGDCKKSFYLTEEREKKLVMTFFLMIEITSEVILSLFDTSASVGASEVGFAAREKNSGCLSGFN